MNDELSLRATFDQVAELYNQARPAYPDALFTTLIQVTGLSPTAKVLEIGPGTGQATKALASYGYDITGVELGAALSQVARRQLRDYPRVRILTAAFEEVELPENTFHLVLAATSFHWIRAEFQYAKPHRLLQPQGCLAIIHTHHISDQQGDDFFKASQPIYDRYHFTDEKQPPLLPSPEAIQPTRMDEGLFRPIYFQGFPVVIAYSATAFANLLNTYSNHLIAPPQMRHDFLKEIEQLINEHFDGHIQKHFLMSLTVAQKKGFAK